MRCSPFIVCCLLLFLFQKKALSVVRCVLLVACRLLCGVCCLVFAIACCLLFVVGIVLCVGVCSLFLARCTVVVVCREMFVLC